MKMSLRASWLRKPVGIALVACIVLAASLSIAIFAEAPATIALTPDYGYGNTIVTISGSGFTAWSTVRIYFADILVLSTRSGSDGSFTGNFIVPTDQNGVYTVSAVDLRGRKATASFKVIINPMLVEIKEEVKNIEGKLDQLLKPPPPLPPLEGEVTIGALLPLSGELATLGENERVAIELAVEEVNAFLTEAGAAWTLKVLFEDTELKPDVALAKLKELYEKEGIKFIVGPLSSGEVKNIKGYADANKILVVSHGSTAVWPELLEDDFIFRFYAQDAVQGRAIARLMCDEGISTVVAVYEMYWGTGLVDATEKRFEELTGKGFAEKMPYDPEAPDFPTSLAADLASAVDTYNADGVLYIGGEEAVDFFTEAKKYDILWTVKWYGNEVTCLSGALLDPEVAGFCAATPTPRFINPIFSPTKSDKYWEVHDEVWAVYEREADPYAYVAYDIVWALTYSLFTVNTYDSEAVRTVLQSLRFFSFFGASGLIVLDENGDRTVGDYDLWAIVEVEAGVKYEWKHVGTWLYDTDSITWL